MPRITHVISTVFRIEEDGAYRLFFVGGTGRANYFAVWDTDVERAGTATLSFDGNYGLNGLGVMNFAAGSNAFASNVRLKFIDLDVHGLPPGGAFLFYCYP